MMSEPVLLRCGFFVCPAGVRPLGPCAPPRATGRDSCGGDPAARPCPGPLGVSRCTGSPTPRPGSARRVPAAAGIMAAGTRGADRRPPARSATGRAGGGVVPGWRDLPCRCMADGRVGVTSAPRAIGAIPPERAGTEPADRRAETRATRGRNPRGEPRGSARRATVLGRTRRRVGGLRSMRSPNDCSEPAGQSKVRSHPLGKKRATTQLKKVGAAPSPRGKQ
jgi:hypothetical protein